MCADLLNLERDIKTLEKGGVDFFHLDITDGHYVPNFTMGYDMVRAIKKVTWIPLDVHLTVDNPEEHIRSCAEAGADIITIHPEVTRHLDVALQDIRNWGKKSCLAIAPHIPLSIIDEVPAAVDVINIMTVAPGFAGQKAYPGAIDKIKSAKEMLSVRGGRHPLIAVDGNVSYQNIPLMINYGADILILGTSSLFKKDVSLAHSLSDLKDYLHALSL